MNKNQHIKYTGDGALVSLWWPKLYGKLQQPPKVGVCGRGLMRGEISSQTQIWMVVKIMSDAEFITALALTCSGKVQVERA